MASTHAISPLDDPTMQLEIVLHCATKGNCHVIPGHPIPRTSYSDYTGGAPFICIIPKSLLEFEYEISACLVKEVAKTFSYKRFGIQKYIESFKFADHKLTGVCFAIDWAETGLDHLDIGTGELIKLEVKDDGTFDYQTSPTVIAGKTELEICNMDLEVGFNRIAAAGWKGHLIAHCYLEGESLSKEEYIRRLEEYNGERNDSTE